MFKIFKNRKKGFTLIETVVALGIIVVLSGLTITTISAISQAKMREVAQTIKAEFETTRNLAKTHGGDAEFAITKTDDSIIITRTQQIGTDPTKWPKEEIEFADENISVYYKKTGDAKPDYELGVDRDSSVTNNTLRMTFSQTQGSIIGPNKLDYIVLSNGSKNYKLIIKQSTGMMYYDYEIDEAEVKGNALNGEIKEIQLPTFIQKGEFLTNLPDFKKTGETIQPELNYDARYVRISGVYRAKDPDPNGYQIIFSLKDPYTTVWAGGGTEDKILTWYIAE